MKVKLQLKSILLVASLLLCTLQAVDDPKRIACEQVREEIRGNSTVRNLYNILSLDGGGIRGLIPGQIIEKLETVAFDYAKDQGITDKPKFQECFSYDGKDGRIAIKDMFDMVAGTSTGSIIAAGLTYPKDEGAEYDNNQWIPKYWAEDISEVYSKQGGQIFKAKEGMSVGLMVLLIIVYMIIFGAIGYFFGRRWYDNPEKDKLFENMEKLVSIQKAVYKGQSIKQKDMDCDIDFLKKQKKKKGMDRAFGKGSDSFFSTLFKTDEESKPKKELQETGMRVENFEGGEHENMNKVVPDLSYNAKTNQENDSMIKTENQMNDSEFQRLKDQVFEFLDFGKEENAKTAKALLMEEKEKYQKRKACKWFIMLLFMAIGSVFLILFTTMITFVSNSLYDRTAIEDLMRSMIGKRNITQALVEEIMITAYEYNSQQPKLFTKYGAIQEPNRFQVLASNATGSSSAAPGFFEPQKIINGYSQEELLIDGGIIANNPALLAYMFAQHIYSKDDIRIMSLGTGQPSPTTYDLDGWNYMDYSTLQTDLMIDVDVDMSAYQVSLVQKRNAEILKNETSREVHNYLRAQCITNLAMDQVDDENINGLIATGQELYKNESESIDKMVKQIVDEKFGPLLVMN